MSATRSDCWRLLARTASTGSGGGSASNISGGMPPRDGETPFRRCHKPRVEAATWPSEETGRFRSWSRPFSMVSSARRTSGPTRSRPHAVRLPAASVAASWEDWALRSTDSSSLRASSTLSYGSAFTCSPTRAATRSNVVSATARTAASAASASEEPNTVARRPSRLETSASTLTAEDCSDSRKSTCSRRAASHSSQVDDVPEGRRGSDEAAAAAAAVVGSTEANSSAGLEGSEEGKGPRESADRASARARYRRRRVSRHSRRSWRAFAAETSAGSCDRSGSCAICVPLSFSMSCPSAVKPVGCPAAPRAHGRRRLRTSVSEVRKGPLLAVDAVGPLPEPVMRPLRGAFSYGELHPLIFVTLRRHRSYWRLASDGVEPRPATVAAGIET